MNVSVEPPPETFNFARHLLDVNAGRPDKTAFVDDERRLTYGELDERVRRFAAALKDAGVKREERVLLLMLEFVRLAGRFPRARSSPAPCRSRSIPCSPPTTTPTCSSTPARKPRSSAAR